MARVERSRATILISASSYLCNCTFRGLRLAERDKAAILLDLHRDIDDVAKATKVLLERILGDAFALHEDGEAGLWLFFGQKVGFLVAARVLLLLEGLIKCWNWSNAAALVCCWRL